MKAEIGNNLATGPASEQLVSENIKIKKELELANIEV
jgi:hypothetical protein